LNQAQMAKRYARAFVQRIAERPDAVAVLGELRGVAEQIYQAKSLRDFFHSPLFTTVEKLAVVAAVAQKAPLQAEVTKTLTMLVEQNRFHVLRDVVEYATRMLAERLRKTRAMVESAVPLSEEVLRRLGDALKRLTGRDPEMKTLVDPGILGGVRVQVGSVLYDGSLKGQLENLREELIKG